MRLSTVLADEVADSHGSLTIKRVPLNRQPSRHTVAALEHEIFAHARANEAVTTKSMLAASGRSMRQY